MMLFLGILGWIAAVVAWCLFGGAHIAFVTTEKELVDEKRRAASMFDACDAKETELAGLLIQYSEVAEDRAHLAKVMGFVCAKTAAPIVITEAELGQLPDGGMLGEYYDAEAAEFTYVCVRPKPAIIPATPEHIM